MRYVKFVFVLGILINILLCSQQGAAVPKLYWSKKEGECVVDFDGVPFSVAYMIAIMESNTRNPKSIKLDGSDCKVHVQVHYDAIVSARTAKVYLGLPVIPCIDSEVICLSDLD